MRDGWIPAPGDVVSWHGCMHMLMTVVWANNNWNGNWRVSARYGDGDVAVIDKGSAFALVSRPQASAPEVKHRKRGRAA